MMSQGTWSWCYAQFDLLAIVNHSFVDKVDAEAHVLSVCEFDGPLLFASSRFLRSMVVASCRR